MPNEFYRSHLLFCMDAECLAKGAHAIEEVLIRELENNAHLLKGRIANIYSAHPRPTDGGENRIHSVETRAAPSVSNRFSTARRAE